MKYDVDIFIHGTGKYVESLIVIASNSDTARRMAESVCNLNSARFGYVVASEEPHPDLHDHIPNWPYKKDPSPACPTGEGWGHIPLLSLRKADR